MVYACTFEVPADEAFYQRAMEAIGYEHADGLLAHIVLKVEGGLRHIEVWESKGEWERYRSTHVGPALARVFSAAGFAKAPPSPDEQSFDVVDVWTNASGGPRT